MALVVADRVQETSVTSGTGTLTLAGAVSGYQTFSSSIGNGNTTFYTIYDNVAYVWEVGIGTVGAGTLSRDTVLSNSSGTTSPINLAGNTAFVFCTYPSEKSVNLNASGNVSPLGTISSGTWQGTTIGVAYGGTGVTTSSGANSVVLRDSNQNIAVNRLNQSDTNTTAAGGTTVLTAASSYSQTLTGTGNQTYRMPDATTLTTGVAFTFNNNATGTLTLEDQANGPITDIASGGAGGLVLINNGTVAGTWNYHGFLPENITWGTNTLYLNSDVITGGTWNGGTITPAYGGTGLTTFTAANNALYSTGATTLTAGTLPVAAGGTGATTFTANGILYGSGTSALGVTAAGTTGQVLLANTSGAPTWGSVPTSGAVTSISFGSTGLTPNSATTGAVTVAGTLAIANGGTGQTTAAAAFDALSPMTTVGDIIYEDTGPTAARLPIGTTGQVLTVSGGIPSWATPASNVSSFQTSLSGLTPSTATTGAVTLAGTLGPTSGGTGLSSYTQGDLIYASATNTLSRLADVATGNALISGGVSADPLWGKIGLTTHVDGTLPTANGGTNLTSFTSGGALYATSTSALTTGTLPIASGGTSATTATAAFDALSPMNSVGDMIYEGTGPTAVRLPIGSTGQILTVSGGIPTWTTPAAGGVTSITGTANQVIASASTGAVTLSTPQSIGTASSVQFGSFGVGTAASGTTGEIRATNNVTAFFSDARLKDFKGTIPNALDKVLALNGYYFTENARAKELGYNNDKVQVGVSAQEVEAVLPEVVTEAPISAEYKTVYYDKLVPLLIEAIKELKAEIDELKGK